MLVWTQVVSSMQFMKDVITNPLVLCQLERILQAYLEIRK